MDTTSTPGPRPLTSDEAVKLIRAAHRVLKSNEFQGGAFNCPECGGEADHPYRCGHNGHFDTCQWKKTQDRLAAALKKGGHRA